MDVIDPIEAVDVRRQDGKLFRPSRRRDGHVVEIVNRPSAALEFRDTIGGGRRDRTSHVDDVEPVEESLEQRAPVCLSDYMY